MKIAQGKHFLAEKKNEKYLHNFIKKNFYKTSSTCVNGRLRTKYQAQLAAWIKYDFKIPREFFPLFMCVDRLGRGLLLNTLNHDLIRIENIVRIHTKGKLFRVKSYMREIKGKSLV